MPHSKTPSSVLEILPRDLPPLFVFRLFSTVDQAHQPNVAQAVRFLVRQGKYDDQSSRLPTILRTHLDDAKDPVTAAELAKALAYFGPKAQSSVPSLKRALTRFQLQGVTDFWFAHTTITALLFIGGPEAEKLLRQVGTQPDTLFQRCGVRVVGAPHSPQQLLGQEINRLRILADPEHGWKAPLPAKPAFSIEPSRKR